MESRRLGTGGREESQKGDETEEFCGKLKAWKTKNRVSGVFSCSASAVHTARGARTRGVAPVGVVGAVDVVDINGALRFGGCGCSERSEGGSGLESGVVFQEMNIEAWGCKVLIVISGLQGL
ncbi:hypothetical protein AAG906_025057 [Vitis piasezkii]